MILDLKFIFFWDFGSDFKSIFPRILDFDLKSFRCQILPKPASGKVFSSCFDWTITDGQYYASLPYYFRISKFLQFLLSLFIRAGH